MNIDLPIPLPDNSLYIFKKIRSKFSCNNKRIVKSNFLSMKSEDSAIRVEKLDDEGPDEKQDNTGAIDA